MEQQVNKALLVPLEVKELPEPPVLKELVVHQDRLVFPV